MSDSIADSKKFANDLARHGKGNTEAVSSSRTHVPDASQIRLLFLLR